MERQTKGLRILDLRDDTSIKQLLCRIDHRNRGGGGLTIV